MTTAILETPKWLIFLRYAQIAFAVIVLALSAYGLSGWSFSAFSFAIFVSLATIIIVLYNVLTVSLPNWANAYNYWAVLALDIVGVIFWVATLGAIAALRASFNISVNLFKRYLYDWYIVASPAYLGAMSGAAAVSAFNFVLFIITLVFTGLALHKARKAGSATAADDSKLESHGMESVLPQQPPPANYGGAPPPANYGGAPPPAANYPTQGPPPPANY